ncbi:hypothetical protein [Humibacter sp. RRB41]|nr:hypothetical protein [Humibacter sp. RRB41]
MSEPSGGIQIVAALASGWCDPDSGVCHIETVDETTIADAGSEH